MSPVPDVMRAAVLKDDFGGPDAFSLEPVPVPQPEPDEVLIRVHTAGVGVWDPAEREGEMVDWMSREPSFPYILGSDGSGTVVSTGEEAKRFEEGDQVYAASFLNPRGGFYAEYIPVKEDLVVPVPDGLSMEEAGVMAVDAVTALRGLQDALELKDGETVLIFGASGGVGHLAVQFAKRMGARILAVVSRADGRDLATELGADEVVESGEDDFTEALRRLAPNGLDAALVTASGEGLDEALGGLRKGARLAWPNGVTPEPELPEGVQGGGYDGAADRKILEDLNRLLAKGPVQVHVDRTFTLEEAGKAHRALDEHYLGKLAIRVAQGEE